VPANKKHHYVPAFYLRRFSTDGKSINLYNIPSSRLVNEANLRSQCYKNYMYGTDPAFEHVLGGAEGEIAGLFRLIDHHGSLPAPFSEAHGALILHMVMQK
jgi:hypothetical protein